MRSARRKKLIESKNKKSLFFGLFFKIGLPVIFLLAVFLFLTFTTRFWNGEDKLAVAYTIPDGNVAVTILDPKLTEVTTLIIPGETQIEVARNYGTLAIKNVWQLGINEKIGGALLSETITQNFLFPVFLWGGKDTESLRNGNIPEILRFIFIPKSSNISFGDRLSIGLFSLKVKGVDRGEIDLGKSQFLTKAKLNDGTNGFTVSGPISPRLTVYFTDSYLANKNIKVEITDETGEVGVALKVGQVVEVMGGKIVSVNKKSVSNIDCTVTGKDSRVIQKVANIFSCKIEKGIGDFDLEITLGKTFAKRF